MGEAVLLSILEHLWSNPCQPIDISRNFLARMGEIRFLGTKPGQSGASTGEEVKENRLMLFWESLFRAGLGETVSRIGTNLLLVALALVVIWGMRAFYLYARKGPDTRQDRFGGRKQARCPRLHPPRSCQPCLL